MSVDGGAADAEHGGDLGDCVLVGVVHLAREGELVGARGFGAPTVASAGPGGGEAGVSAFADQVAFDLGERGGEVEDELPARGGGVDRLLKAAEADIAVGERGDGVYEVA